MIIDEKDNEKDNENDERHKIDAENLDDDNHIRSTLNTPLFTMSQITKRITLPMSQISSSSTSTEHILQEHLHRHFEGKCISEGFVQPDSSKLLRISCGLFRGSDVIYSVLFQCNICTPYEGMEIECSVRDITKAGVRGAARHEVMSPFVVFVPRDPNIDNPFLKIIKMDDTFIARVIGYRFEINDKFISIIADIVNVN